MAESRARNINARRKLHENCFLSQKLYLALNLYWICFESQTNEFFFLQSKVIFFSVAQAFIRSFQV